MSGGWLRDPSRIIRRTMTGDVQAWAAERRMEYDINKSSDLLERCAVCGSSVGYKKYCPDSAVPLVVWDQVIR